MKKIKVHKLLCSLCGSEIILSEEELKAGEFFGEYLVRAGEGTFKQSGDLCSNCIIKPLEK